jgi:hypothetical protein
MAIRTLTFALAAAAMTVGTSANAAAVPARSSASVEQADNLFGGSELFPVAIFMAAILAIMLFTGDDDDDESPASP